MASIGAYDNINGQKNISAAGLSAMHSTNEKAGTSLDMNDFLTLMVAMFQNQDIDNTADTSDMLNQMVQMSVIQAITDISQLISDSTNMTYGASLVGKEVTIGKYNTFGKLEEHVGIVTGTGQMDGKQVVFIGDDMYMLSDVMAVGRMPSTDKADTDNTGNTGTGTNKVGNTENPGGTGSTEAAGSTDTGPGTDAVEGNGPIEDNGADIDPDA